MGRKRRKVEGEINNVGWKENKHTEKWEIETQKWIHAGLERGRDGRREVARSKIKLQSCCFEKEGNMWKAWAEAKGRSNETGGETDEEVARREAHFVFNHFHKRNRRTRAVNDSYVYRWAWILDNSTESLSVCPPSLHTWFQKSSEVADGMLTQESCSLYWISTSVCVQAEWRWSLACFFSA